MDSEMMSLSIFYEDNMKKTPEGWRFSHNYYIVLKGRKYELF